ncbi:MAG: hypothetical protein ABSA97_01680 [Verrucomicrobiia bacterium]
MSVERRVKVQVTWVNHAGESATSALVQIVVPWRRQVTVAAVYDRRRERLAKLLGDSRLLSGCRLG